MDNEANVSAPWRLYKPKNRRFLPEGVFEITLTDDGRLIRLFFSFIHPASVWALKTGH